MVACVGSPSYMEGWGRITWVQEFETSLGNIWRPCLKTKQQKKGNEAVHVETSSELYISEVISLMEEQIWGEISQYMWKHTFFSK